jgi:hypothetical protein
MAEEGFPNVANLSTRAGAVAAQYLLADTTGASPLRYEDLDVGLDFFGRRASVMKFRVVSSWKRMAEKNKK